MTKRISIKTIIIGILIFSLLSAGAFAGGQSEIVADNTQSNGFLIVMIIFDIIMAGLLIVLIKSFVCVKKEMQNICKIVNDKENNNVINIRKHNDDELLEKLYGHIDKRLNEISIKK